MKYTKEITDRIVEQYKSGQTAKQIAETLGVADRSIIAKLSSLGVYQKRRMLTNVARCQLKSTR